MSDPNMGDENVDEHVCPPRSEDLLDRVVDLRRALEESNFEREHWQEFAEAAYDELEQLRDLRRRIRARLDWLQQKQLDPNRNADWDPTRMHEIAELELLLKPPTEEPPTEGT